MWWRVGISIAFLAAAAHAEDRVPLPKDVTGTAEAIVGYLAAEDAGSIRAAAARRAPDPWLVTEALLVRGAVDAARAFAKATHARQREFLLSYVRARGDARADRAAWDLALAFEKNPDADARLRASKQPDINTVTRIQLEHQRMQHERQLHGGTGASLSTLDRLEPALRRMGWRRRLALVLGQRGAVHHEDLEPEAAIAPWEERVHLCAALGRTDNALAALSALYVPMRELGHWTDVRRVCEELRAGLSDPGRELPRARVSVIAAEALLAGGRPEEALEMMEGALVEARAIKDSVLLFDVVLVLGRVHQERTTYAEARALFDEARYIAEGLGDLRRKARAETQLGFQALGVKDNERALAHLERTLEYARQLKTHRGEGASHLNVAAALAGLGRTEEAEEHLGEAIAILERVGDDLGLGRALTSLASSHAARGKLAIARPMLERALALAKKTGDGTGLQTAHRQLVQQAHSEGRLEAAEPHLLALEREAEEHGGWVYRLLALTARVDHERRAARHEVAVRHALEALDWIGEAARDHADKDAATVRTRFAEVISLGALSAHERGDMQALFLFLESSRALLLREALAGGAELRAAMLSPELAVKEAQARKAEAEARAHRDRMRRTRNFKKVRAASLKLQRAQAVFDTVIERIRREQRRAAGILYPQPARVTDVRRALSKGSVVVLLGATVEPHPGIAMVIRREGASSVLLPPVSSWRDMVESLRLDQPTELTLESFVPLRRAIGDTLPLQAEDRRVYLSPADALASVPWSFLLPNRGVVSIPSASAWLAMKRRRLIEAGPVLGLGDPVYGKRILEGPRAAFKQRGGGLTPLPATRTEVNRIADVKLLGEQATEAALDRALRRREAWRAVHLACHGLIDSRDVMRSALAMTETAEDDGLLTVREVYRLPLRAELVVLSACESGRGEVVWGEGMLGLAQAFMVSGASTVLCSLWKVDDKATSALMLKFYELWQADTEGVDAATALSRAQAYIRAQEKWAHPYYWAAWVLWGTAR